MPLSTRSCSVTLRTHGTRKEYLGHNLGQWVYFSLERAWSVHREDEISITVKARPTHTRYRVQPHGHILDRIIFIMNTSIPLGGRLWLCINMLRPSRSALDRGFPLRESETGCVFERSTISISLSGASETAGSMAVGHVKNIFEDFA